MRNKPFTLHDCNVEAKKYKFRFEWQKSHRSTFNTARRNGWLEQCCDHMPNRKTRQPTLWTLENCKIDALKYNSKSEWENANASAYNAARKRKWLKECCQHMIEIRKPIGYWTLKRCKEEALKYDMISMWQKHSSASFYAANYNGWLGECCQHMKRGKRPNGYWTLRTCKKEALKYNTRTEWAKASKSGYDFARINLWLEECCSHMEHAGPSSKAENNLLSVIKQHFPKAHNLKDRKVKIPDKPHIHGFDIDIYIPELRKGIEFDGDYWHSIFGLKRSRGHWPSEDLVDYTAIKDSYFKSKNIDILHINEKDWKIDAQVQIQRCFEFLGIL